MSSTRVALGQQEKSFYETLFNLAGPDITGNIAGRTGAQFFSTSGLPRDTLHKIWSIADNLQQGKLDKESFFVACRLISHCQAGSQPDASLVIREPVILPVFEGIKKQPTMNNIPPGTSTAMRDFDVISVSDMGADNLTNIADAARASNIAMSLSKLGIDPLDFIPFQSGQDLASPKTNLNWSLPEVERQKYIKLFRQMDKENTGSLPGSVCRKLLEKSKLNKRLLGSIWELSDMNRDGNLSEREFVIAMHLTTKCKKGAILPNQLSEDLLSSIPEDVIPRPAFITKPAPAWQYSRTYLDSDPNPLAHGGGEVEETEEEMRHVHDLCGQVESDISRMKIEMDKKRLLINELESEKRLLTEKRTGIVDCRKKLSIDKISLQRDRAKLQSEILHLQKLISDSNKDNDILKNTIREQENEIEKIRVQVGTLGSQRKEAVRQHGEELDKIQFEQRDTSNLLESFNRINRDEEVMLESKRIQAEREKLISQMNEKISIPQSTSVSSNERSNKWATSLLGDQKKAASTASSPRVIGFGTRFFQ